MHAVAGLLAATLGAAATGTPQGPNEDRVSPGLAGFITVFVLALVVVLLMRSMVKHLRNVRYGPGPDGVRPGSSEPAPGDATPPGSTPDEPTPDAGPAAR
jgi:hypothetical protein